MIQNLNNLLNISTNKDNIPSLCLISAADEYYPLLNFTINDLKTKLYDYSNQSSFNIDKDYDWSQIMQKVSTKTLFNEKNYTEIIFKTKPTIAQEKKLIEIFEALDNNNFLLIITDKLDKKDISANWIKKIKEKGIAISLSNTDIKSIINYKLQQNNLTIENSALDLLIQQNFANMSNLIQELNKITIIYPKGHILLSDIQNISTNNSRYNIYQFSNAYLAGNLSNSLSVFDNIYQSTEDEILIIWMIGEDLRRLINIKAFIKQGINLNEAISNLKVWGETVNHLKSAHQRLNYSILIKLFDKLSITDMIVKGAINGNTKLELLKIITLLCTGKD